MQIQLTDKAEIGDVRVTADGYVTGTARVARTGIQEYLAYELGITDGDQNRVVRVYRPEEEVFSTDSLATYAYRPVTSNHPSVPVTAANWKEHSRGQTGPDIARDGEFVRVPMVLMDRSIIKEWEDGKRELSMGYSAEIVMTDGVTPEGEKYDAIQKNLRMNHLALVSRARGGDKLKLGDAKQEGPSVTTKTIMFDGISIEVTDAGAQAIEKLQGQLKDASTKAAEADAAHKAAIADKEKELATKDAEIDALKAKVLDDAAIDKRVQERADLIGVAKSVVDGDYSGLSADDIRKKVVIAKLGDAAVKDKSVEYVNARFDILAEDAAKDPHRAIVQHSGPAPAGSEKAMNDTYDAYLKNLNAHRKKEAK